ncbi:MAG: DUF4258 domain-containing protein [Candidatus Sungbacteria bacterium]|uniref:DUF4258 domain-containing protein n=1 Tax=Candidatus Sungiibacteriota bacterium TaxID=2750080 RepID=A0A931YDL0_9BACT|nr:DUF4258 domain-containing protein [Candidatus Sungbacteria bacterium]
MKFEFSPHAQKRIKERSISKKLVTNALEFPTRISSDKHGRQLVKKLYTDKKKARRLLLVAIEITGNIIKIITVIDTSKINKYLHEKEK